MGYDKPKHLSFPGGGTGGHLSAPIVRDFLKDALAGKPAVPFRVPPGIKLVRVDLKTGLRAGPGTEKAILEAFKPGTAPPDNYSVVGGMGDDGSGRAPAGYVSPDAERAVRSSGTGGLY
jgi:penicillin-binding protein 1A